MDAFQNAFLRKLRDRITAEISQRESDVLAGALVDHSAYLVRVEAIKTLKLVRDTFFEEVANDLLAENRGEPAPRPARRFPATPPYGV